MVRACLIDVYDTILHSRFRPRTAALVEPLGLSLEDWLAEFETMRADRDRGGLTVADSFARTLQALGREPEPELVAELSRRDAELALEFVQLCEDAVTFLGWLRSAGVATALVSNCGDTTRELLADIGILSLVDAVVLSCEVGSAKPDPDIYVAALEELSVAAADAVFIDDQPAFCAGAQAVGVRPIQVARGGADSVASRGDFPVVDSFAQVQPLL